MSGWDGSVALVGLFAEEMIPWQDPVMPSVAAAAAAVAVAVAVGCTVAAPGLKRLLRTFVVELAGVALVVAEAVVVVMKVKSSCLPLRRTKW
jgi:hypothetical protein